MMMGKKENEMMLARLLGIDEDEAANRLGQSAAIHANSEPASAFAAEISDLLSRTVAIVPPGERCDIEIMLGDSTPAFDCGQHLFVELSDSKVTVLGHSFSGSIVGGNGIHRYIAACYVASVVLGILLGISKSGAPNVSLSVPFSSLGASRDLLEKPLHLQDAVLAGAGAVGNSFLRALRHLDVRGELHVADPKNVSGGNLNRCHYFGPDEVGQAKAVTLCRKAQPDFPNLLLIPFHGTLSALVASKGRVKLAITAMDSRRGRRAAQLELPLEVVDASTTDASEIIVHSHRQPTDGACLACIYRHVPDELARERDIAGGLGIKMEDLAKGFIDHETAVLISVAHPDLNPDDIFGMSFDSLFKQRCGQQALVLPGGEQVLAPFAFVSALAGAMQVVELSRHQAEVSDIERTNYFAVDPWHPPNPRARLFRPKSPDCTFCHDKASQAALLRVWKDVISKAA
jgi:hypothetical protein